jgi:hypothetical protein
VRHFHQSKLWITFDLHVLGTPPAFVLSQDQTLQLIYLKKLEPLNLNCLAILFINCSKKPTILSYYSVFKDQIFLLRCLLRCFIFRCSRRSNLLKLPSIVNIFFPICFFLFPLNLFPGRPAALQSPSQ